MDLSDLPPEADLEDADQRLSTALQKGIVGDKADRAEPADLLRTQGSWMDRIRGFVRSPAFRPVMAVAGLLVIVLGIQQIYQSTGGDGPSRVLRGNESIENPAPVLKPPRITGDGGMLFEWQQSTGADSYRVVFYTPDMMEIAEYDAGPDRSLVLDPDEILALREKCGTIFWGVTAFHGLDRLAESKRRLLKLPE
jgi:hypothetical protein